MAQKKHDGKKAEGEKAASQPPRIKGKMLDPGRVEQGYLGGMERDTTIRISGTVKEMPSENGIDAGISVSDLCERAVIGESFTVRTDNMLGADMEGGTIAIEGKLDEVTERHASIVDGAPVTRETSRIEQMMIDLVDRMNGLVLGTKKDP